MTAGPIDRAFRFLKRTAVSGGGVVEGGGASGEDKGGVVFSGEEAGELAGDGLASGRCSGSSCAERGNAIENKTNNAQ
jgi:hypothetical protein